MKHHILLLFFISVLSSYGQEKLTNEIIETSINSKTLNEEREILIFNPTNSKNNFPTIYLIDGKQNFFLVAGIISNLRRSGFITKVNLVGINTYDYERPYNLLTKNNNGRDFSFNSGGSSDFQKFITDEVFPLVNSTVSTSDYKILIGHSFGGLFGLNMLMENPNSFSSAVLIDASIWWNNANLLSNLKKNKSTLKKIPLYLSRSAKDEDKINSFESLEPLIKSNQIVLEKFPNENHISTLTPSIVNGLKYIFKDFEMLDSVYEEADLTAIKERIEQVSNYYDTPILPNVYGLAPIARNLANEGEFSKSIEMLKYLEKYHPENNMVLDFLGEAYQKSGDLRLAKITWNKSLKIAKSKKSSTKWVEKKLSEIEK